MTFVCVAQAARHLGIDAKTLHRWLAEAQLPLSRHPHDGRTQAMSSEHLPVLARLHQRSLALLPQERSGSLADERPPLPPALLALPEQLGTLQVQLTALLQQDAQQSASPAPPTPQTRTTSRPAKPSRPAPRARPVAKPPHKPSHVIPRVESGGEGHYVVICPTQGLLAFEPDWGLPMVGTESRNKSIAQKSQGSRKYSLEKLFGRGRRLSKRTMVAQVHAFREGKVIYPLHIDLLETQRS